MNTLSEYDLKQIRLIQQTISLFESHKLDLFDLVNGLRGLLCILESVDVSWKEDFRAKINCLEMIHDSIEDGSISTWRGGFEEDLHKSVAKLKRMTNSLLDEYLRISDPNILEIAIEVNSDWIICPKCNDAWESNSTDAMVVCPKCERAFHNPRVMLREKITQKSICLEDYGINDLAWSKEDAKSLINSIMKDKIGILGGDVYKLTSNRLDPLCDNWSCEPMDTESEEEYYFRSKSESLRYIENYSVQPGERIIFSITFTEKLI